MRKFHICRIWGFPSVCVCVSRLPILRADSSRFYRVPLFNYPTGHLSAVLSARGSTRGILSSTGIPDRTSWRGLVPLHDIRESIGQSKHLFIHDPHPVRPLTLRVVPTQRYASYTGSSQGKLKKVISGEGCAGQSPTEHVSDDYRNSVAVIHVLALWDVATVP